MGIFRPLKKNKDIGVLLFRLFIGIRLLYGVLDNILVQARMQEFAAFLKAHFFPYPLIAAQVSVYAQALAGLMIILGFKIRWAAVLMVINFLVAIIMVHWGQTIEEMTPALAMLFAAILFLFIGAGRYSVDREPLVYSRRY